MANFKETLFQKLKSETDKSESDNEQKTGKTFRFVVFMMSILICSTFFSLKLDQDDLGSNYSIHEGGIWHQKSVIADYSFPIRKERSEYLQEVENAKKNSLFVFKRAESNADLFAKKLDVVLVPHELTNENNPDEKQEVKNYNSALNLLSSIIKSLIDKAYRSGFINLELDNIPHNEIISEWENVREIIPKSNLYDQIRLRNEFKSLLEVEIPSKYRDEFEQLFNQLIIPNLLFDEVLTGLNKEQEASKVSKTNGIVRKGEIIIHKGETITETHIAKVSSYELTKYMTTEKDTIIFRYLGSIGHVSLIISFIIIFIYRIRKKIYFDNLKFSLVNLFLILPAFFAWISMDIVTPYPIEYLIFLPAISMLSAIIFDMRTAFYLTISMSLLVAGVRNNDYMLSVIMLFAGFFSLYSVGQIQNRSQVYKSILYVFGGFAIPILIFGFERSFGIELIIESIVVSSINAAMSPVITFGLLFIIEKTTSITTDLSLMEFDNLNHPMLLKLNELAPGTYQHTLGVATLAERCAGEIGANALFCKVSTYYHDLGKMKRPEYFAENQMNEEMENKHNLISPFKSAQIIRNHVIEGINIAKEIKLPAAMIDIIPMHHGTSVIKHFYAKEVENKGIENVNIEDFSYPGPKPNSREAAIIMICDSAEAVSRLEGQTKEELERMINDIILNFTRQGQFDECEISVKELATIRKVLGATLMAKGHKRVKYKKIEDDDESSN